MKNLLSVLKKKNAVLLLVLVLILAISFETSQQLFYIRRFNLSDDATFFGILKNQSYSWALWVLFSGFIYLFVGQSLSNKAVTWQLVIQYFLLVLLLVFLNILLLSAIQLVLGPDSFSISRLFSEYVTFYAFQKGPIFTLGYIAVLVIAHLHKRNEQLSVKVQSLSDIKASHAEIYNALQQKIDEKAKILNIKIGNRRKIIPVEHIVWIEADDYCVKIHTIDGSSYTMRSSLKALNEKLDDNFLRIHRKSIVNMTMATELDLSDAPKLLLSNSTKVPISKSHLKLVRSFLS